MATLAELATYCQRNGWPDSSAGGLAQLKAWINDVLKFLALERRWPFYETVGYFNTAVPYTTGTVTLAKASTAVVGSETTFAAGMVGQELYAADDSGHVYIVATFTDTTHLTLASAYLGTGGGGLAYSLRYIRYAAPTDWGQEGTAYLEDGRELNFASLGQAEFHRLRMIHRGTDSYPRELLHAVLAGTHYFYVEPAPSAGKQIRYSYYRVPATITDNDSADMPDYFRGLLHQALQIRAHLDTNDTGIAALKDREYQRQIDKAFDVQQPRRPIELSVGAPQRGRIGLNGLGSILQFTDPAV